MKQILILVDHIRPTHTKLATSIQNELGKSGITCLALFSDIFIHLQNNQSIVTINNKNILEFDFVYFRRTGKYIALAHTIAFILKDKNIPYADSAFGADGAFGDKFTSLARLSVAGLPIIESCFVWKHEAENFSEKVEQTFGYPVVCKDRFLQRGRGVTLIKNKKSLEEIFHTTRRQQFLFQKFVESKQEYRLLVLGNQVKIFESKTPENKDEFRANVSLGATEEFLPVSSIPTKMKNIAVEAARVLNLEVAGVDIMVDKQNNIWLLEVNRAPGLTYNEDLSPELKEMAKYFKEVI